MGAGASTFVSISLMFYCFINRKHTKQINQAHLYQAIFIKTFHKIYSFSAMVILPAPIAMKHYRSIDSVDGICKAAMAPLFETLRPLYLLPRCV